MKQNAIPLSELEERIAVEGDQAARIAAANAWAVGLRKAETSTDSKNRFDLVLVPELLATALSQTSTNLRMRSVFALRRADTPGAVEALARVAADCEQPKVAQAAQNALSALTPYVP